VIYRIKDDHYGRYITNKPTAPEFANYNPMRSNARKFTGLEDIEVKWDEHLIEIEEVITITKRKTIRFKDLKEVQHD